MSFYNPKGLLCYYLAYVLNVVAAAVLSMFILNVAMFWMGWLAGLTIYNKNTNMHFGLIWLLMQFS